MGHVADLPFLTCCTCLLMLNRGGAHNVRDDFETGSTEHVAVVDMLHMLAYAQHGGWGAYNVLEAFETGSMMIMMMEMVVMMMMVVVVVVMVMVMVMVVVMMMMMMMDDG